MFKSNQLQKATFGMMFIGLNMDQFILQFYSYQTKLVVENGMNMGQFTGRSHSLQTYICLKSRIVTQNKNLILSESNVLTKSTTHPRGKELNLAVGNTLNLVKEHGTRYIFPIMKDNKLNQEYFHVNNNWNFI